MLRKITLGLKSPLFIILLIAAAVLTFNINKPFWGHHDWNGVYWGQVAKNFAVNGPLATSFAMYLNAGPVIEGYNYNFHFFPTFTLLWAIFFKIFGIANWVSRLFAIVFSLGAIALFYQLATRAFNRKTAVIASLFWMVTPMFIYFGKMPVHEIPLMFFVLLTFWFHLTNNYKLTIISTICAMLVTWPGFFLVPVLSLVNRRYWILWPAAVLLFSLHLSHNYFITGDFFGGGLREIFFQRVSGVNPAWYLKTLVSWSWQYYSLLIPLSLIGLLFRRHEITILFLLYAVIYPIVFRDSASRHDYLLIYFLPFLALSSALIVRRYLPALVIASVMLLLRWDFIVALQESSLYRESVRIGEYVKTRTVPGDKVQIISHDKSVPFDGWFASYYSDRPVIYTTDPNELNPDYKTFYFFPGGNIKAGAEISNRGIK